MNFVGFCMYILQFSKVLCCKLPDPSLLGNGLHVIFQLIFDRVIFLKKIKIFVNPFPHRTCLNMSAADYILKYCNKDRNVSIWSHLSLCYSILSNIVQLHRFLHVYFTIFKSCLLQISYIRTIPYEGTD